jgi:hypothetical protein
MVLQKTGLVFLLVLLLHTSFGQGRNSKPLVYVDKKGILRYTGTNKEAAFFGVNYTVPFAYGYRSHKALGVDLKKAIDNDVYHLARLGIDAFRVHVWDTEITDAAGNLLVNDHLDLFDYLLLKLKERNIKILLTPIAFWGNGYPEKDERTPGFSSIYNKQQALVNDTAIRAQENYLEQFFTHVNKYTGVTYTADPDVIAMEINNEPHHSGPKAGATSYVNRLAAAVRNAGWAKPVFYNISESPYYADAIAAAHIDGVSFQWYPTGLVANRTLQGNLLPNVDRYAIPFDTIPAYRNKARAVYEFDAGDVLQPVMYPAMARSFRTAGFQWATQFAYDPMCTAYANTEYQTHYLNLAYTPSKAISLLIAGKVFHQVPLYKSYGTYPADTLFEACRVSYAEGVSEWNTDTAFYYANTTATKPVRAQQLQHLAGVGSSPVVQYNGTGAYFLDKIEEGMWRLELMPDMVQLKDPFEKASPAKEVRRIQWNWQQMNLMLPDLGDDFTVSAVNRDNSTHPKVSGNGYMLYPGTYLLVKKGKETKKDLNKRVGNLDLAAFVAPPPFDASVDVNHQPFEELTAGKPAVIQATVAGVDATAKVWIEGSRRGGQWFKIAMLPQSLYNYTVELPADLLQPGLLNYRIIVQQGSTFTVFPGNQKGDPYAWDHIPGNTWNSYITTGNAMLLLLDASKQTDIMMLPAYTPGAYTAGDRSGSLAIRINGNASKENTVTGISRAVAAQLAGRHSELAGFNTLVVRARVTGNATATARVALVTTDAAAFAAPVPVTGVFQDIEISLQNLSADQALLLPRPYPGFMPLWLKESSHAAFDLRKLDKIEVTTVPALPGESGAAPYTIEIESVWLKVK